MWSRTNSYTENQFCAIPGLNSVGVKKHDTQLQLEIHLYVSVGGADEKSINNTYYGLNYIPPKFIC